MDVNFTEPKFDFPYDFLIQKIKITSMPMFYSNSVTIDYKNKTKIGGKHKIVFNL